jgi:hypothetical protein
MLRAPDAAVAAIVRPAILAVLGRPMAFPDDYCATFAARLVLDLTGADLLGNQFAGTFVATENEALARHPLGLAVTLARRMTALGWARVPAATAPAGSVAVLRTGHRGPAAHSVGVALGTSLFVRRASTGVVFQPARDAARCWAPDVTGGSPWRS